MAGISDFTDEIDPGAAYDADFARYLAESQKAIEADIARIVKAINEEKATRTEANMLQYLIANRQQIQDQIEGRVSDTLDQTVKAAYKDLLDQSKADSMADKINADVLTSDIGALKPLQQNVAVWFETAGAEAANKVFSGLMSYVVTGNQGMLSAFIDNMSDEKFARYGQLIVHNHLNAFYRQTNALRAVKSGVTRWRYSGPAPQRPFCSAIYGKIFTRAEINAMDNGQTGDVMTTCGGYNCKHRWVPVAASIGQDIGQSDEEIQKKLDAIAVGDGTLANSGRGKVFIKNGKSYSGIIQRSIHTDDKGAYYMRFTGEKQYLAKDANGRYFIDGSQGSAQSRKGPPAAPKTTPGSGTKLKPASDTRAAVSSASSIKEAHDILALPPELKNKISFVDRINGAIRTSSMRAVDFLENMVSRDFSIDGLRFTKLRPGGRAEYDPITRSVTVDADIGTIVHEMSHHLEIRNRDILKAAIQFREKRRNGEDYVSLKSLYPKKKYKRKEMAFEDEWVKKGWSDAYPGKIYPKDFATEIVTMGMEKMYNDPISFAKNDPEYFDFILKFIQKRP